LLGMTNSRMKDYLDLAVLLEHEVLDPNTLANAIAATFARRCTEIPSVLPKGLSDEFSNDPSRQKLWSIFLAKNELPPRTLPDFEMNFLPRCITQNGSYEDVVQIKMRY